MGADRNPVRMTCETPAGGLRAMAGLAKRLEVCVVVRAAGPLWVDMIYFEKSVGLGIERRAAREDRAEQSKGVRLGTPSFQKMVRAAVLTLALARVSVPQEDSRTLARCRRHPSCSVLGFRDVPRRKVQPPASTCKDCLPGAPAPAGTRDMEERTPYGVFNAGITGERGRGRVWVTTELCAGQREELLTSRACADILLPIARTSTRWMVAQPDLDRWDDPHLFFHSSTIRSTDHWKHATVRSKIGSLESGIDRSSYRVFSVLRRGPIVTSAAF